MASAGAYAYFHILSDNDAAHHSIFYRLIAHPDVEQMVSVTFILLIGLISKHTHSPPELYAVHKSCIVCQPLN